MALEYKQQTFFSPLENPRLYWKRPSCVLCNLVTKHMDPTELNSVSVTYSTWYNRAGALLYSIVQ